MFTLGECLKDQRAVSNSSDTLQTKHCSRLKKKKIMKTSLERKKKRISERKLSCSLRKGLTVNTFLWDTENPWRSLEGALWSFSTRVGQPVSASIMMDFASATRDLCQRKEFSQNKTDEDVNCVFSFLISTGTSRDHSNWVGPLLHTTSDPLSLCFPCGLCLLLQLSYGSSSPLCKLQPALFAYVNSTSFHTPFSAPPLCLPADVCCDPTTQNACTCADTQPWLCFCSLYPLLTDS